MKPNSKFLSLFFILLICTPLIYKIGFYGYYSCSKGNFISTYCININVPEKKCDGKCHLKKIAGAEKNLQDNSPLENKSSLSQCKNLDWSFLYKPSFQNHFESFQRIYAILFKLIIRQNSSQLFDSGFVQNLEQPPSVVNTI